MIMYLDHREHRSDKEADEQVFPPVVLPKMSGRMYYYLFGKPIETHRREQILKGKEGAAELYLQIKWEVEHILAYLLKKREEDPYRNIFDRVVHRVLHPPMREIPGFRP